MTSVASLPTISPVRRRAGLFLAGIVVAFLLFDSVTKLMRLPSIVQGFAQSGWPVSLVPVIGGILFVCIVLYVIPRTSILGAILTTGYLGGAVATNLRLGTPLFTIMLTPVYAGILLWGALYLLDDRLHVLIPLRRPRPGR